MKQSPIFSRTYDLLKWLIPATAKFPREQRFVVAEALQRHAFAFQERLIDASHGADLEGALQAADATLVKLRLYLRLSHDLGLLKAGQYEHAGRMVDEIGRLLGAWRLKVSGKRR